VLLEYNYDNGVGTAVIQLIRDTSSQTIIDALGSDTHKFDLCVATSIRQLQLHRGSVMTCAIPVFICMCFSMSGPIVKYISFRKQSAVSDSSHHRTDIVAPPASTRMIDIPRPPPFFLALMKYLHLK
jgi:hypothetical protein